ncbi:MAG: (Fe-S)-binding protein [Bacillota bacterium]|jgi:glycolate oxidase iron-sulfur subunit
MPSVQNNLDSFLTKCNRCGSCQSVCPVYMEMGTESAVARGKIRLVKALHEGEIKMIPDVAKRLDICLQCKRCTVNCPGGCQGDFIVREGRAKALETIGPHILYTAIARWFLPRRWIFNTGLGMGKFGQKVLFRKGPNGQGMLPRIPFGIDMRRIISPLAPKTMRQLLPETISVEKPVLRIAYFTGCMANFIYPQVGEALVHVLKTNNVEVIIPGKQHCCGMPTSASGDMKTARIMAEENIKVFSALNVDYIIFTCGSCGLAWKEYPELFEEGSKLRVQAEALATKVKDITELVLLLDYTKHLGSLSGKVTYHDPCHLKNGLKVVDQPRDILKSIPGMEFTDNPNGLCCGSGGSFSLKHYELSRKITERCVNKLMQTGGEIVATGCMACRMQIEDTVTRNGHPLEVRHTIELLAESYGRK